MNIINLRFFDTDSTNSLLVVGGSGTGKSNLINAIIRLHYLKTYSPEQVKFLLLDFKQTEFHDFPQDYLYSSIVVDTDTALDKLDEISKLVKAKKNHKNRPLIFVCIYECDATVANQEKFDNAVSNINRNARTANIKLVYVTQSPRNDTVSQNLASSFDLIIHTERHGVFYQVNPKDLLFSARSKPIEENSKHWSVTSLNRLLVTKVSIAMIGVIAGAMLLFALGNQSSQFYNILRIVVLTASLITAFSLYKTKNNNLSWIFMAIGVLFNPIYPIYLQKDLWKIIDIVCAIIFIANVSNNIFKIDDMRILKRKFVDNIKKIFILSIIVLTCICSTIYLYSPYSVFITPTVDYDYVGADGEFANVRVHGQASLLSDVKIYINDKYDSTVKVDNNGTYSKNYHFVDDGSKNIQVKQFNNSDSITFLNIHLKIPAYNSPFQYLP